MDRAGDQEPAYPVGTVINGHVWTGSQWAPVVVPVSSGVPAAGRSMPRRRGDWFRPKVVIGAWVGFVVVVLGLGFIPVPSVQVVVSIVWMIGLTVGGLATLIALTLWLAGVGSRPAEAGD